MKLSTMKDTEYEDDLFDFISNSMYQYSEGYARKRPYASDAAYCPRKNFLFSKKEIVSNMYSEFDAASQIYMTIGLAIEEKIAESLEKKGDLISHNTYLSLHPNCKINVGGKIDLVYFDHNDDLTITELKTCGKLKTEPDFRHLSQLATYSILGGFDNANLIYVSRDVKDWKTNSLKMQVFTLDTSKEVLEYHANYLISTHLSLRQNWLPRIPKGHKKTVRCKYCDLIPYCWGDKKIPDSLQKLEVQSSDYGRIKNQINVIWDEIWNDRKNYFKNSVSGFIQNSSSESVKSRLQKLI